MINLLQSHKVDKKHPLDLPINHVADLTAIMVAEAALNETNKYEKKIANCAWGDQKTHGCEPVEPSVYNLNHIIKTIKNI
jgi:hypothetical protein